MLRAVLALLVACHPFGAAALAQDVALPPAYATINHASAEADPIVVQVMAGGDIDARHLGGSCVGMIASAPTVRLNYRAGDHPLFITARSAEDTTLLVNLPSGEWICNDDFRGLDPGVVLRNPPSGAYAIWVGTFGTQPVPAEVFVSETPTR